MPEILFKANNKFIFKRCLTLYKIFLSSSFLWFYDLYIYIR